MKLTALLTMLMATSGLLANWTGTYYGSVNGDNLVMKLEQSGSTITGSMEDSYQYFVIDGTVSDQNFVGTATENSLQIQFELFAIKRGNELDCKLLIDVYGTVTESAFSVQKEDANAAPTTQQVGSKSTAIPFPSGATFPAAMTGTWTQNESYNSGSGDNFMGANFSQAMTFHSDGTLSEGGSSASMSGSNYSNQSSGAGTGKIDGIGWYTKQKNFYLIMFNAGSWTSVHVGTWYAENNHLLITGLDGEKLLLSK